ncbi:MarR family transcriptional regulator [Paenibacillus filicis]|uniref:MarR family transcriptional regulator n=1 Tax=Paenibacillus filicis TaxID=669464 RepID=A0ABU9DFW0_9BACL
MMFNPHASTPLEKWTRLTVRRWHAEITAMLRQTLPRQQYYLLETLREGEPITCSDIAEQLQITLPAVTNLSQKLVDSGYVERTGSDKDRRRVCLRLTPAGVEILHELDAAAAEMVRRLWSPLDTEEQEQLTRLLQKSFEHYT